MLPVDSLMMKWLPWIRNSIKPESEVHWSSLVINKRKPWTVRAWAMPDKDTRVCLHQFYPCQPHEAFAHPHAWPAEFLVLQGAYLEMIWRGHDEPRDSQTPIVESMYTPGSWHQIKNDQTWHKVVPYLPTYTIMINGPEYPNPNPHTRTTKGKDLDYLKEDELNAHLKNFAVLLDAYANSFNFAVNYEVAQ